MILRFSTGFRTNKILGVKNWHPINTVFKIRLRLGKPDLEVEIEYVKTRLPTDHADVHLL